MNMLLVALPWNWSHSVLSGEHNVHKVLHIGFQAILLECGRRKRQREIQSPLSYRPGLRYWSFCTSFT
jgi:hypothetical protein